MAEQAASAAAMGLTEEQQQVILTVREFVEREVRPVARELELADRYPHEIVDRMKELGFFGLTIPEEYDGLGLDVVTYACIVEEICRVWMSISGILNTHLMLAYLIRTFGTPEQKQRYLPRMAAGEIRGGLCLTEPDAGSDVAAIRATAVRRDDHYVINGTKMFVTNGREGHVFALLAKTDTKVRPPHDGISMFVVEKNHPGIQVARDIHKLGYRGVDTVEIIFQDYVVPAENLVGGVEGQGFRQIAAGLELGRVNVASRAVGVGQAALEAAVRYAQQRSAFGKPILQHQAIQLKLADMATKVEAARLLVRQAALKKQHGERADLECGMAKLFASETAAEVALDSMRIHGGYGYTTEFDVERYYRDAPLMIIGEGTNEIQRLIIARQLAQRYPA